MTAIEPRNLGSVSQRSQTIALGLVYAIPGCIGVIKRHRIRWITTVGIRDALHRVDVAKPRHRSQA
ncbi:MAG TPA: hypothetical protein PK493_19670, partial [Pseudomonadota bacterium]|nr:hypothetical protein [Pseudomonadota bacterium]